MNHQEFLITIGPFKDKIFRLAKRLLVSTEEAEDATQEVLVKLWSKKDSLLIYNSVQALALTITKNYCLDQLKSKRAGNLQLVHSNFADHQAGVLQQLEDADSLQWVEKIIDQLPVQQRLILQMRDIEQLDFSEISEIVEMNETAVRVALSRARKFVRENMVKTHQYGTR